MSLIFTDSKMTTKSDPIIHVLLTIHNRLIKLTASFKRLDENCYYFLLLNTLLNVYHGLTNASTAANTPAFIAYFFTYSEIIAFLKIWKWRPICELQFKSSF